MKVKVENGQPYQLTNAEVDIAIDKYLEMQGYETWSNLSDEDKQVVLGQQWEEQKLYELYMKNDWHE